MTPTPTKEQIEPDDGGHMWNQRIFASMQIKCCMNCGFIKNADKPNRPCPGPIYVVLREQPQNKGGAA